MSTHETTNSPPASRDRLQVWWVTIAAFAIVIAYADGFWLTSLQGAVGAIERRQPPFERWLRDSTLMLPLFFLAVLAAVLLARRLVGKGHRGLVKIGTAGLLIVLLTSGVAVTEMAASSAFDYHLQTQELEQRQHLNHSSVVALPGTAAQTPAGTCTGLCASERDTLNVHLRALRYGSLALLLTNLVLVLVVMTLRGDRLWRRPDASPMSVEPVMPKELSLV